MKFVGKLLASVVLLAVVSGAVVYGWMSRDRGPSNLTLAEADLAPVIPFRDFFADMHAEWQWRISPDSEQVAWHAATFGGVNVKVAPINDMSNPVTIKTGSLDDMFWHVDNRVAVLRQGRLWAIDPNQPEQENWVDITPRGFDRWHIVKPSLSEEDFAVVLSNDREPEAFDLFRTDSNFRDRVMVQRNPGNVVNYGLTPQGDSVIRVVRIDDNTFGVETRDAPDGDSWTRATVFGNRDTFLVSFIPDHGADYYAISNRDRDLSALVRVNWETGEETVIAENDKADITSAITFFVGSQMPDIAFAPTAEQFALPISELGRQMVAAIDPDTTLADLDFTAVSQEAKQISYRASYDGKFWINRLFDVDSGRISALGAGRFGRHNDFLAKTQNVYFKASDGLQIPALLTLPTGLKDVGKLPTIVHIHGGPASFEASGYRGVDQFLANRGYAVLSVNFRGSTGFGKNFRAAGYGEVGAAMQSDIVDAARWLIEEGIADPAAIGVMGGSYGGYAAALAMTRDPDLFRAAVVDYAVLDIPYQMDNNPYAWRLNLDEMQRYFGDPNDAADRARMHEMSPINHADDVHGPILITHGKLDNVVGFEQSERFAEALAGFNKEHELLLFENEGHGYRQWQTNVVYWRKVETFFAKHLGGIDGGFDYVEFGPRLFPG